MLKYFMKEQWKKVFSHYLDDDPLDRPSYMPESKFSAPIVAQVILFVINTYLLRIADVRSLSPLVLTILITVIAMAAFNDDFKEWCKGTFIYFCGHIIVIIIIMFPRRPHVSGRPFFPLDTLFTLAIIFGVQFVIWCVIKSIKQVKRM